MKFADMILLSLFAHCLGDWIFQDAWISDNKSNPRHAASYLHAAIHALCLLAVFGSKFPWIFWIVPIHWLVDLRFALVWWRKNFKMTIDGPAALHVAIWQDQAVHFIAIVLVVWWNVRIG